MQDEPQAPTPSSRQQMATLDNLWNGIESVVTGSYLFRTVDEASRRELVERGVAEVFPSGRAILVEGEAGKDFYLIDQGVVEVTTLGVDGHAVVLATLQRGAFFGEVSMLTGMPRTATVTALTDVCAVRFDKADIDVVLDRSPATRRLLETLIAGRARDAYEKVVRASTAAPAAPPAPEGGGQP